MYLIIGGDVIVETTLNRHQNHKFLPSESIFFIIEGQMASYFQVTIAG